jgi:hypothetical protein
MFEYLLCVIVEINPLSWMRSSVGFILKGYAAFLGLDSNLEITVESDTNHMDKCFFFI